MLCEQCQTREATVFLTKETLQGKQEHKLCEACAFHSEESTFQTNPQPMTIQQFLSNWFGQPDSISKVRPYHESSIVCTHCNMSYEQFLKIGKFGCEHCYETFREQLPSIFSKLHNGNIQHTGKIANNYNQQLAIERKIEEIRDRMDEAVREERFEEAAKFRDEARHLEEQLQSGGDDDVN